jgi:hypothetical protein
MIQESIFKSYFFDKKVIIFVQVERFDKIKRYLAYPRSGSHRAEFKLNFLVNKV